MKWLFAALLFSTSSTLWAGQLALEYSTFYSHLRKLDNDDTPALQFAFGFKNVQTQGLCQIQSALIRTQKQDIPVVVSDEHRFTLPTEKALKLAKALVMLDLVEPNNRCDMSVQLETKPEYLKTVYSYQELEDIFSQYQAFFDNMGSFLSFLMPSATGLAVHLADSGGFDSKSARVKLEQGKLILDANWFEQGAGLELTTKPLRITAVTTK